MNPTHDDRQHRQLAEFLRTAMPPIGEAELPRDLWPGMLKRMESSELRRVRFDLRDWIIAGLVAATVLSFPGLITGLLYYL
jgi:hypothetical protein